MSQPPSSHHRPLFAQVLGGPCQTPRSTEFLTGSLHPRHSSRSILVVSVFLFLFSPLFPPFPSFALSDFDCTFKTRDVTRPLSGPGERIGGRRASRDPFGGTNLVNPFQTLRLSVVLLVLLLLDPRVYYRKIFFLVYDRKKFE